MAMTYEQALKEYDDLFGKPSAWNISLFTGDKPLTGYSVFNTKEAAETFIAGDSQGSEIYYDVYPGAVISVIGDTNAENNGLYQVLYNDSSAVGSSLYKLNYICDASTVQKLINDSSISGLMSIQEVDIQSSSNSNSASLDDDEPERGEGSDEPVGDTLDPEHNKIIYFTGTDSSVSSHDTSTLYFTKNIAYDTQGNLYNATNLGTSDIRLKTDITPIDVDLNDLSLIDKISFIWKDSVNKNRTIGVSAQSVEAVFPELVVEREDTGYKTVNYQGLTAVALAAVDKLYDRIKQLESFVYNK